MDLYLRGEGIDPPVALQLSQALVSALLDRAIARNEMYAARKLANQPDAANLLASISAAYQALLETEGRRRLEPPPPRSNRLSYARWRAKFKGLAHTLTVSGAHEIAREALKTIPAAAWKTVDPRKDRTPGSERKTRPRNTDSRRVVRASRKGVDSSTSRRPK